MSTRERYSILVRDAICALSYLVEPRLYCFLTVGEVAEKAGVSEMTARKYMNVWADEGHLSRATYPRLKLYRMIVTSED